VTPRPRAAATAWHRRTLVALVLAAAIAALAVFGLASKRSLGRVAPALPSERLSGPPVTIGGLVASAGGRRTLVTFWASWCGPCASEAPALERFTRARRGRLVGVDISDGVAEARAFIAHNHWTFANVRDAESSVGHAYGLIGPPATFVIDGAGRIAGELRGPQTLASLTRALGDAG
jgi:thiol-disulfide isomerase/thioredoxin